MKSLILIIYCFLPTLVFSQQNQGIGFQTFNSWKEVLIKAKKEHKIIFVDAYATWCGPCKQMDAETYSDQTIGLLMKNSFIALKVQFDQNKNDNEHVRNWYLDVKYLTEKYAIDVFPTILFFTPNGDLLNKELGYQDVKQFTSLLKKATDPAFNYSNQISQFQKGTLKR